MIPTVPFSACLDRLAADSLVDDYHSAALGRKTQVGGCGAGRGAAPPLGGVVWCVHRVPFLVVEAPYLSRAAAPVC